MQSDSTRSRTDSKAPVRKGRIIGVDIGNYRIKMAACNNGVLEKFISVQHPDNMVKGNQIVSWQAMGDYLKELVKASGIRGKGGCCHTAAGLNLHQTHDHAADDGSAAENQPSV